MSCSISFFKTQTSSWFDYKINYSGTPHVSRFKVFF